MGRASCLPAVILSTVPVVSAAKLYLASTPLPLSEIALDMAVPMGVTGVVAAGLSLAPGRSGVKSVALALGVLAAGVYPALASRTGLAACSRADTAFGTLFLASVALFLVMLARRTDALLEGLEGVVWGIALLFLVYVGYSEGLRALRAAKAPDRGALGGAAVTLDPREPAPDIIHIVFDGMGRLDELGATYGLDADEAHRVLSQAGLRVNDEAVANYAQTYLSIASMLSMDYLDAARPLARSPSDRGLTAAVIAQSNVIRALKARGYRFTLLSSGYEVLATHPLADDGITGPTLIGQFETYLLPRTMFRSLPIRTLTFAPYRRRTREVLAALAGYQPGDRPRFVLAHVLLPHPPFAFDASGRDVTPSGLFTLDDGSAFRGTDQQFRAGYAAQARFVLSTIQDLLARWNRLPRPPIVIVQGDHGSGLGYDIKNPAGSNTSGRMRIFLGIAGLGEGARVPASPVNIYRTVFDQRFGADLPLLPDRSFISSWATPYEWVETKVQ